MRIPTFIVLITLILLLFNCGAPEKKLTKNTDEQNRANIYRKNLKINTQIITYDQYANEDLKGFGTQISENLVAIPFTLAHKAASVRILYLGEEIKPMARGFVWFDISTNILFLRVSGPPRHFTALAESPKDTAVYGLKIYQGKLQRYAIKQDSNITIGGVLFARISNKNASIGSAVFTTNHKLAGLITRVNIDGVNHQIIYPAHLLKSIIDTLPNKVKAISALRFKTDKVYPSAKDVKSFDIETTLGSIKIELSDKLPEYKNNFIRLCSDGYYDSLLVHRVLKNFLIQMGASDTKYAKSDDPVGYRGPGYNLPTIITPGLFHKRGAIAASKPPSYSNSHNRSDGSQFYIISGRTFNDDELNELENQKKIKFTNLQREIYKTQGGAPYLDGDYTVFGEVTKGMDVVDKIASIATRDDDRPIQDIRIKTIQIIEK